MELNEILKRVKEVINDVAMLDIGEVDHEKDLSGELDSLDNVELVMGLEDEFSLEIPDEAVWLGNAMYIQYFVQFLDSTLHAINTKQLID